MKWELFDLQYGTTDASIKIKGIGKVLFQFQSFVQLGSVSKLYYGLGYLWEPVDHENKVTNNGMELTSANGQDAAKVNAGFDLTLGSSLLFGTNVEYFKMMDGQQTDNNMGTVTSVEVTEGDYYVISSYFEFPQWSHLTLFAAYSKQEDSQSAGQVYQEQTQVRSYGLSAQFDLGNKVSFIPQVSLVRPDKLLDMMSNKDENKMINASLQARFVF